VKITAETTLAFYKISVIKTVT